MSSCSLNMCECVDCGKNRSIYTRNPWNHNHFIIVTSVTCKYLDKINKKGIFYLRFWLLERYLLIGVHYFIKAVPFSNHVRRLKKLHRISTFQVLCPHWALVWNKWHSDVWFTESKSDFLNYKQVMNFLN